jgi:4a-hydroxytetrahydrobiopterin dehydratase
VDAIDRNGGAASWRTVCEMRLISDAELEQALSTLGWQIADGQLRKVVRRKDFAEALAFVNAVGALAEQANHHPDIDVRWNTVTLHLMTHSKGGFTDTDIALASAIDEVT